PGWRPPGSHPPDADGPSPPRMFRDYPDHLFREIALFDAAGELVAGTPGPSNNTLYRDITVDNNVVGRIGLRKIDRLVDPPGMNFLDQQLKIFCFIGVGALLLCAVVSFLLSRHLLSPIRQLVQGTHDLAGLKFDTRITVSSSDELGQLAGDFNRMAETLERYEQMRRQWISDISHELRTPLSIIRGEIEAMQDGVREFSKTALDSLHAEVLTLTRTVGDLHELSLADSGALHFDWQPVNPALVFQDTLNHYRERFDKRRISIRDRLDMAPERLISGDERRLRQLFSNILENSIRYTDSPGTLTIRQTCSDKELSIFIEDSGPGVPPQALARIFDRLFRVDFARSRSGEGSGLGLSICKMIAEAHQGSIRAEAGEAGGLKLIVSFPLLQTT
ncbi:MAG: ATP-binding protein, partial [Desulfosalsimonadaceae bacterium]|nr:ATP-binding protein [Desulfosalsimonadaceae bacterium]